MKRPQLKTELKAFDEPEEKTEKTEERDIFKSRELKQDRFKQMKDYEQKVADGTSTEEEEANFRRKREIATSMRDRAPEMDDSFNELQAQLKGM